MPSVKHNLHLTCKFNYFFDIVQFEYISNVIRLILTILCISMMRNYHYHLLKYSDWYPYFDCYHNYNIFRPSWLGLWNTPTEFLQRVRVSWIWHQTIWWWSSSNAEALGNVEYPFVAFTARSCLVQRGSTW